MVHLILFLGEICTMHIRVYIFVALMLILVLYSFLFSKTCVILCNYRIEKRGPPCNEWSGINARRKGVDSESGSLILQFAKLINKVKKYNQKYHDVNHRTYFFCENVPEVGKVSEIENTFGISAFKVDAKTWGPCFRERAFFFNWEPNTVPEVDSVAKGTSCLKDGWKMVSFSTFFSIAFFSERIIFA